MTTVKQRFKEAIKSKNKLGLFQDTKETDKGLRILGEDARIFGFKPLEQTLRRKGLFAKGLTRDAEFALIRNIKKQV